MKVNYNGKVNVVSISDIKVGETFLTERKSRKDEMAVYMKIDSNSGILKREGFSHHAVNLTTGQIRHFCSEHFVEKINAEVEIK